MKKLLIGVVALVVVIGGVGVYIFLSAGDIVKQVVEDVGSRVTETKVTLKSVDLSVQTGEAALNGFTMGNPTGFNTPKAMSFGVVSVKLDTGSLTSDTIRINEVVIEKPEITYELGGSGSNFDVIQKNVNAYAKVAGGGGGGQKQESGSDGGKKVIIDNLYVRDGKIAVSATFLEGKQMGAALPTIHLKDIGKKKGGATAAEVTDQLMSAITKSVTSSVSSLNLGKMMDKAKEAEKMLEGGAGGAMKMMEGSGDATKKMEDATKGMGDSLKGLMGK